MNKIYKLSLLVLVVATLVGCKKGGSIPSAEEIVAAIPTPTPTPVPTPTPLPAYITVVSSNVTLSDAVSAGAYLNVSTLSTASELMYSLYASPSSFMSGAAKTQVSVSCGTSAWTASRLNESYNNNQVIYEMTSGGDLMSYSRTNGSSCTVTAKATIGVNDIAAIVTAENNIFVLDRGWGKYSMLNGATWTPVSASYIRAVTDGKNYFVSDGSGVVTCIHNPNTATACPATSVTFDSTAESLIGVVNSEVITLDLSSKELRSYPLAGGSSTLIYTLTEITESFTSNVSMRINTKELYINAAPTLYRVTW